MGRDELTDLREVVGNRTSLEVSIIKSMVSVDSDETGAVETVA